MAFKILAAFVVVCVAQNALAASIAVDKPSAEKSEVMNAPNEVFGVRMGNPFACIPHIGDLWTRVQELKDLIAEFNKIRIHNSELKESCTKLNGNDAILDCMQKADQETQKDLNSFFAKIKEFVPKAVDIIQKFKDCLFGW